MYVSLIACLLYLVFLLYATSLTSVSVRASSATWRGAGDARAGGCARGVRGGEGRRRRRRAAVTRSGPRVPRASSARLPPARPAPPAIRPAPATCWRSLLHHRRHPPASASTRQHPPASASTRQRRPRSLCQPAQPAADSQLSTQIELGKKTANSRITILIEQYPRRAATSRNHIILFMSHFPPLRCLGLLHF